jgi:hypothetical protein
LTQVYIIIMCSFQHLDIYERYTGSYIIYMIVKYIKLFKNIQGWLRINDIVVLGSSQARFSHALVLPHGNCHWIYILKTKLDFVKE